MASKKSNRTNWTKLKADYLAGKGVAELARKYKLMENTISNRLSRDGVTKKRKEVENTLAEVTQKNIIEELNYPAVESFKQFQKMRDLALCPDGDSGKLDLTNGIKAQVEMSKLAKLYVEISERKITNTNPFEVRIRE